MRTKVLLGAAVVLMLAISVATIGSNMGFKISIPLYASGTGHSGLNWVSLPYYNSYASASVAFADIPGVQELDQWQEGTQGYRVYDGFLNTDDFPIAPGGILSNATAILVKVGADTNWIVVGSHDPSLAVTLYANGPSHSGLNWAAIPYHTTAATASVLFSQIAGVQELDQWQETTQGYRVYDGFLNTDDFPITPGVPVLIKVGSQGTWTPAHY